MELSELVKSDNTDNTGLVSTDGFSGFVLSALSEINDTIKEIKSGKRIDIAPAWCKTFSNFYTLRSGRYRGYTAAEKNGKTQNTSNIEIFSIIDELCEKRDLVAFNSKNECVSTINYNWLYFNYEESPESIIQRYIAYLLAMYTPISENEFCSPETLLSFNNKTPSVETLKNITQIPEILWCLRYFQTHVHFVVVDKISGEEFLTEEQTNPTGFLKTCQKWIEQFGEPIKKFHTKKDGSEGYKIKGIIPFDKTVRLCVIIDHIGCTTPEQGKSMMETVNQFSTHSRRLRNMYHKILSIGWVHQQNQELKDNTSIAMGRIFPTTRGLAEGKKPSQDANSFIGICNPFEFGVDSVTIGNETYNIPLYKGKLIFLEIIANRNGLKNIKKPCFFFGQCSVIVEDNRKNGIKPSYENAIEDAILEMCTSIDNYKQQLMGLVKYLYLLGCNYSEKDISVSKAIDSLSRLDLSKITLRKLITKYKVK